MSQKVLVWHVGGLFHGVEREHAKRGRGCPRRFCVTFRWLAPKAWKRVIIKRGRVCPRRLWCDMWVVGSKELKGKESRGGGYVAGGFGVTFGWLVSRN